MSEISDDCENRIIPSAAKRFHYCNHFTIMNVRNFLQFTSKSYMMRTMDFAIWSVSDRSLFSILEIAVFPTPNFSPNFSSVRERVDKEARGHYNVDIGNRNNYEAKAHWHTKKKGEYEWKKKEKTQ